MNTAAKIAASTFILLVPALATAQTSEVWRREQSRWGLPQVQSVEEAVSFLTNTTHFLASQVPAGGSSWFPITTASGVTTDNWRVESTALLLFAGFGKECIPSLIELLDHDELYVRHAAYVLLQQKAGRRDDAHGFYSTNSEVRRATAQEWRDWWNQNSDNPRLDRPPRRVYNTTEWEEGQ